MSIIDHLPVSEATFAPEPFTHEQLVAYDTRRRQLTKALDLYESTAHHARHHTLVKGLVARHARNIIEFTVPSEVLVPLGLASDNAESEPISLADVYLLAYAADASGDRTVWEGLGYVLSTIQPHSSNYLEEAYRRAGVPGKIMATYTDIVRERDTALDDTLDPTIQKPAPLASTAAWAGFQD